MGDERLSSGSRRALSEAAHAGETSTRLNLVAAWREATAFTDAERAALEFADAAGGVTDEVWANAATTTRSNWLPWCR
ncbi:hypothetical protein [Actinomadura madurae]|uniref:hypothetical protein n=1 Tax=Actinomadura madurae TaxID=1993 RepID=UPI00202612B1|nr:hypothetical protein [Actinomadura madurae]MCP9955519.1 hypothetical protein [Actinomadura madurae]MCP9972257.1 hypothetical protein [Actinomadura madurae]MCQ0003686.1 hypothetical protein [Actinomadura madurae]MCQ0020952.1 hypothetical protein [Actinomadura madurae]URN03121.1 hypothetical protein LUW74_07030 [Actinomadura madurae]